MDKKKRESYMNWAIALALEGEGRTLPNPMVGAVVVKGDEIVGEGYHCIAGTPHAEIHALNDASDKARSADMFVTLEPCSHFGKTPPCADAIVRAGIKRVFIGTKDPNPLVNGKGIRFLKKAGIEVHTGILKEKCQTLNDAYNKSIMTGLPLVTAKVALSLDGKIATHCGDSKWITNASCRQYVHRLRSTVDGIIVGGGTVRSDDPRLNVRLKGWHGRQPKSIIIDESLAIPRKSKVFRRAHGDSIFFTTSKAPKTRVDWIRSHGFDVIPCRPTSRGLVSLQNVLTKLGGMGMSSILLEGGGQLFTDFMKRKLVDRLIVCISPKLIGGEGKDFLPGISIGKVSDAFELNNVDIKTFGDNVVIEGRLK